MGLETNKVTYKESWQLLRLKELCTRISDGTHFTPEYVNEGVPFISVKDIYSEKVNFEKCKYITKEAHQELIKRCFPEKDDILITKSGTIGRMALVPGNPDFSLFVSVALLKNKKDLIESKFLKYCLENFLNHINIAQDIKGGLLKNFHLEDIRETLIPKVEIPEQQAIVAKIEELLSDLDNGKQQLQTAQQQLKVYRQSLLKAAFEGKLSEEWRKKQPELQSSIQLLKKIKSERENILNLNKIKVKTIASISQEEIEELPKLPDGAVWVKLGEILWSVKDGPHYSPKYQDHGIPFISGGNIRPNGIDFKNVKYISQELHDELSKRCKPMKMDVLYTKGGTTGIAKVNDYDIDFNVWVHVAVLKAIPSINPYYLQYVLNSNHCYKQSQNYTHGVGNQDLGLTRMILITLPVFSIEEQNYIVSELESKLTVCDNIQETISQSLQMAETMRQSILKKAFEGKLV